MIYFILGILLVTVIIIMVVVLKKKKEDTYVEEVKENITVLNENDVNMMNGLNVNNVSTPKKSTAIPIPDFNKKGPIGYVDQSKTLNASGDRAAQNFNNK